MYSKDIRFAEKKLKIASILNNFHGRASTNKKIQKYEQPGYLKYKIKENFQTLAKLRHPTPPAEDKLIRGKVAIYLVD